MWLWNEFFSNVHKLFVSSSTLVSFDMQICVVAQLQTIFTVLTFEGTDKTEEAIVAY